MADQNTKHEFSSQSTRDMQYRCVCGEELSFAIEAESIQCPNCKRVYSAEVFKETIDHSLRTQSLEQSSSWSDLAQEIPNSSILLEKGGQIEHFKIVDVLGKGGMGAVYRAIDESLERYVALKVIGKKISKSNHSDYEHLLQEARAQARLNHPNVVQIFYVQHKADEGTPFFAMELVQGDTLEDRLKKDALPFAEVIELSLQILSALKHARVYDIVHGDIKPSNILFSSQDTVKLADFGLSSIVSSDSDDQQSGSVGGTPAYMSPEQASGERGDFRSDMYSLGIMMFQMSFGCMPYKIRVKNLRSYLEAHKNSDIEYFPSKWPESIPEDWKAVIEKLLAKNPAERFSDYEELIEELKRLRPQNFPIAGRLSRGLAWLIDLSIAMGLNIIFVFPVINNSGFLKSNPVYSLLALVLPLLVPYTVCFLQGYWKTSPGKKLFQICIMDKHGKALNRSKLELRMAIQMLPLLLFNLAVSLNLLGTSQLLRLTVFVGSILFVLDFLFGVFAKERRSLHDWLLGTRVVLDLNPQEPKKRKTKKA